MKKLIIKLLSLCTTVAAGFSIMTCTANAFNFRGIELPQSIKETEFPLNSHEIEQAESFIKANDRAGLYDFLDHTSRLSADYRYYLWSRKSVDGKYTNEYIIDNDEYYENMINHFVYPHERELKYPYSDEELKEIEAFIEADDRIGLYDYIEESGRYKNYADISIYGMLWDKYPTSDVEWIQAHLNDPRYKIELFSGGKCAYVEEYRIDDADYERVLKRIVYPHEKEMVYPMSDEEMVTAEGYIEVDDRIGLYEFLITLKKFKYNNLFIWQSTGYKQNESAYPIHEDSIYEYILSYYVYPHEAIQINPIAPATPTLGDVNMDNKISLSDIIMTNKMNTGAIEIQNYEQAYAADVDGSFVIDGDDVYIMMQYAVNLIDSFPAIEASIN